MGWCAAWLLQWGEEKRIRAMRPVDSQRYLFPMPHGPLTACQRPSRLPLTDLLSVQWGHIQSGTIFRTNWPTIITSVVSCKTCMCEAKYFICSANVQSKSTNDGETEVGMCSESIKFQVDLLLEKVLLIVFATLQTRWVGKSSPWLHPVYHILYNYHVYWIFIFRVTKEPSACSSSPVGL